MYIAYLDTVLEFYEPHQSESYTIVTLNVNIGLKYFCRQTGILIRPADVRKSKRFHVKKPLQFQSSFKVINYDTYNLTFVLLYY